MSTKDVEVFGPGVWVYCKQHVNPHLTGWCSVNTNQKIKLDAVTGEDAVAECRAKGYPLFSDTADKTVGG